MLTSASGCPASLWAAATVILWSPATGRNSSQPPAGKSGAWPCHIGNLPPEADHKQAMDRLPYSFLVPVALALGLAPFVPEPHLVEKTRMLMAGELSRPIDIFDLFFHGAPIALLLVKVGVDLRAKWKEKG
jgi:hypothetical protein